MAKRVVFLFSDTGGGHRSAAEALSSALKAHWGAALETQLVDVFREYAPPPFHRSAEWYVHATRGKALEWALSYKLTNQRVGYHSYAALIWPYIGPAMKRFFREHPAEVYVSVHPVLSQLVKVLRPQPTPFITVVTDPVTFHRTWCHPQLDVCIVATERARQLALRFGMPAEKVRVIGLPVSEKFSSITEDQATLKQKLGWGEKPAVLIVGGGEGMGPLGKMALAISRARLECEVAVVCGRNEKLRQRLLATRWNVPVHIYGFAKNMPELMRAADVLVTKAGPGTINEAFIVGRPILIYSRLPGQEKGNVAQVVEEGAGLWTPTPEKLVTALRGWLGPEGERARLQAAANAHRLARPNATAEIADVISEYLKQDG